MDKSTYLLKTFFIILLIMTLATPGLCAPPKPRPFTGVAALLVHLPLIQPEISPIILYREPGVGRIGEFPLTKLPRLTTTADTLLAVFAKKGSWLKIAYDEAGREGWLEPARRWQYQPWEQFLRGRLVRLLPGIKKKFYTLQNEPSETAIQLDSLTRQHNLRVIEIKGCWAMVMVGINSYGWLRWHDTDGRFLISIDASFAP